MRIALPVVQGELSKHFGHCETFDFFNVDSEKKITARESKSPPPHEPGVLPRWLSEEGADVIIAGGMGNRARMLFQDQGIDVVVGATSRDLEKIVEQYIAGELEVGDNICDH